MKRLIIGILLMTMVFIFPNQAFADDFTIDDFTIDAQLEKDGSVQVKEVLTYRFIGSFNGVTRELYPKEGSSISHLRAEENGKALEIEAHDGEYKIHRKAKDETVAIELNYTITDGIERYSDMAQFYWPFFDDRNETDFENVSITVRPPEPTDDVIAMGYDVARGTENVEEGGSVNFELGEVTGGKNADVRVGYAASLFSGAPLAANDPLRPELVKEQESLAAAQARYDNMHRLSGQLAPFILGAAALLLIIAVSYGIRLQKKRIEEAGQSYPEAYFVPEADMSLPATLRFTVPHAEGIQVQTAALLDLLRKGYIEKDGEEGFRVKDRNTEYKHERLLIEWLFDGFGDGETFTFADLDVLKGDKLTVRSEAEKYSTLQAKWETSVKDEIQANTLKGGAKGIRVLSALTGFLLIAPMIIFGMYGQPMWLFFSIVLGVALVLFGLLYNPKTVKGYGIQKQWEAFRKRLPDMSESDMNEQLDDEQKRAVIYGVGTKALEKNSMFASPASLQDGHHAPIMNYFLIGTMATHHLDRAGTAVASSTASSSGGGSSGGGVGGGGGGAGAF